MEQKYSNDITESYDVEDLKKEENKTYSYILNLILITFGLFVISLLLNISDKIRNYNQTAGVISIIIFAILFVFFYIRPILSIFRMRYFETAISGKNIILANRHNIKTRREIAKRIINLRQNKEYANWYDARLVQNLKVALDNNNNDEIYNRLKVLMEKSIKTTSNKIIVSSAVQSGLYSALVPSQQLDALLVASVNFKMVKDILFLYGFRPTKARLIKIYINSISASLAAYGLEGSGVGSFIARVLSRLPIIPTMSSYVADALAQALANGTFTLLIGYKAIDYLKKEYKLQVLIKEVDVLDDNNEFETTKKEIEEELNKKIPNVVKVLGSRVKKKQ